MFNLHRLLLSFHYALRGLRATWHSEQNFRIQVVAGLVALLVALLLGFSVLRLVVLVFAVTFVLVLELLNTFFEKLIDLLTPRLHHYVGVLKDLLAAVVLVGSIGALILEVLLFWPYVGW